MEAIPLIRELIAAMRHGGFESHANELQRLLDELLGGSAQEQRHAAQTISANCHVKCYGDLNIHVPGNGSYPLWTHLSRIKDALAAF